MDPLEIQSLIEEASEALRCGEDVRAVAIADQLAAAVPDHPVVRAIRAQALLSSEDSEAALSEAQRAVELDGENPLAHLLLGLAAWRAAKLSLAQESLERAVRLSRRSPKYLAHYAWFMASERGPRPAEQVARDAVDADAASSTAWAALGLAQYRLHQFRQAEASLRRALVLNPNDIYAQSAMVVLLQDQRKDAKALALVDLLEDSPGAEDLVAAVREEAQRRQIAKMLLERHAMPEPPGRPSPRRYSAWMVAIAVISAGLCLLWQPNAIGIFIFCVFVPLIFLWYLRRAFD
jgi:Tfp pilus assembly protein PilF